MYSKLKENSWDILLSSCNLNWLPWKHLLVRLSNLRFHMRFKICIYIWTMPMLYVMIYYKHQCEMWFDLQVSTPRLVMRSVASLRRKFSFKLIKLNILLNRAHVLHYFAQWRNLKLSPFVLTHSFVLQPFIYYGMYAVFV